MGREVKYEGKHELFIPPAVLVAAQRVGRGIQRRVWALEHGVFAGGWLKCGFCGCHILYNSEEKVAMTSGKVSTFHYYHYANGKMLHASQAGMKVNESCLWEAFEHAVNAISISPDLGKQQV